MLLSKMVLLLEGIFLQGTGAALAMHRKLQGIARMLIMHKQRFHGVIDVR